VAYSLKEPRRIKVGSQEMNYLERFRLGPGVRVKLTDMPPDRRLPNARRPEGGYYEG
jgi:hypothetical protein